MSEMIKSVEDRYKKLKDQHEHILKKPNMYIGSIEKERSPMWVYNENNNNGSEPTIISKEIEYVPGLYKIFDEILVNARDHVVRCREENREPCTIIKVTINKEEGKITVWNNGEGIPVVIHKEENMYVPSMIFGELLSSTNYNEEEQRKVGGTNGLGAKLTNIYSILFEVETLDSENNKFFYQKFTNNMYNKEKPVIASGRGKKSYTCVKFIPDFKRFGIDGLTDDIMSLFKKRVYDIAMTTSAKVYYNDMLIMENNFTKYVDLYFPDGSEHKKVFDIDNENWKVCVVYDPTDTLEHQNISFVNGICTYKNGTHVDYVSNQITNRLKSIVLKKIKNTNIKPNIIKENLIFFVDACVINPDFDSQTKEHLKTRPSNFGSTYKVSDFFLKKIIKTGVIEHIVANVKARADANIGRGGKKGAIRFDKLYDAHRAHLRQGDCTLILTEGDSAKTFALSGLNVTGRDYYGVFPLKGKLLNVRVESPINVAKNEEIQAITQIVGLERNKSYNDTKGLRYGNIMVLTDQDSVTSDTPLLLRRVNGKIEIKTIDDLTDKWENDMFGKEIGTTSYQIWTEIGWSNIIKIIRHKVKKNIYRIATRTGVVDVTEDHSLLRLNGQEISPNKCSIGELLLHSFPKMEPGIIENEISEEYVMGSFWRNGLCTIKNGISQWYILSICRNHLEKCKIILEKIYHLDFTIGKVDAKWQMKISDGCYKLTMSCKKENTPIIKKYSELFILKLKGYIPIEIINGKYSIRKQFFNGYLDNDRISKTISIEGKINTQNIFYLAKSLGYEMEISHNIKEQNIYHLALTDYVKEPHKIIGIHLLGKTEQYVYDLETENHHFQAGIGQLIVHNTDGSHIKGLVMNFIHYYWPSLIKIEGFIRSISTPLLKAIKGSNKKKQVLQFTNMQSFEEWKKNNNEGKGWTIKYYKGLGTHSPVEAQECFTNLEDKIIHYYWSKCEKETIKDSSKTIDEEIGKEPIESKCNDICEDAITLAFSKGRENDRKEWLNTYDPNVYLDDSYRKISFYDFIHKELIAFSVYNTLRSVPNLMDGFKPGQRKVYYGSVKKNIYIHEIKVAQLSGYISENTHYHHGEQSLNDTIIRMAQNYVGSNNINLLMPIGQFGSRINGGKDAASPRYIHTKLESIGKKIFIEEDFDILNQQFEDGDRIEPQFYAPIIPMILVNGIRGIGTGYSSTIEPCNPRDICDNIKRILHGEKVRKIRPWYRHFAGTVEKIDDKRYISRAKYEIIGNDTIHITDLPIGVWTEDYKEFLNNLLDQKNKKDQQNMKQVNTTSSKGKSGSKTTKSKKNMKSGTSRVSKKNKIGTDIKTYTEDCTEIRVSFTITFRPGRLNTYIKNGTLEKLLKLATPLSLTNMHLFDENGKIKKYSSYGSILKNYAAVRLELYQKRKDYLLDKWKKEMNVLYWKLKFVEGVISEKIVVFRKRTDEIIEQLENLKFPKFITGDKINPTYDYLTSMSILKFTEDEVEKLRNQMEEKKKEIKILEDKSPSQIWEEELDSFMDAYDEWEKIQEMEYNERLSQKRQNRRKKNR